MTGDRFRGAAEALMDRADVEGVLSGTFYTSDPPSARAKPLSKPRAKPLSKPEHYKVICISMYTDDLARLDGMVDDLKRRGLTKANRSALIRLALDAMDLDKIPRGL